MKQLIILYLSIACSIYGSTPEISSNAELAHPPPLRSIRRATPPPLPLTFYTENNISLSQQISPIPTGFRSPLQTDDNNPASSFLYIWAAPGSELNRINGVILDHQLNQAYLQITVQEPAKKNRANDATRKLLSELLCIELSTIEIVEGKDHPQKKVRISLSNKRLEYLLAKKSQ